MLSTHNEPNLTKSRLKAANEILVDVRDYTSTELADADISNYSETGGQFNPKTYEVDRVDPDQDTPSPSKVDIRLLPETGGNI